MDYPQTHAAVPSQPQAAVPRVTGDCVYQFAIILAALLMIVTAALF